MALPAADVFTGTNGTALTTYSASWTLNSGNFEIQSNQVRSNAAATETGAHWNADAFTANHYASVVFTNLAGTPYIGPAVRCHASAATYYGYYSSSSVRYIIKNVAGTPTVLATVAAGIADTHTMRLEASGTTITPKDNGVTDSGLGAQSDAAIASGSAGISGYASGAGCRGDTFAADNLAATVTGTGWASGGQGGWF